MATTSGYARTVRLWSCGADPASAPVIFEVLPDRTSASGSFDEEDGTVYFFEKLDFFNTLTRSGDRTGPSAVLDVPTDAWFS